MSETVDARGLSCPQPVLMAMEQMKKTQTGEIVVLVDAEASKENVSRAAVAQGWDIKDIQEEAREYRITIERG